MAYKTYHTEVRVTTTGGTDVRLPVDSLTVSAVPVSGSGGITTELFDLQVVQRVDAWRHRVTMTWSELREAKSQALYDAIVQITAEGGGTIEIDPDNAGDEKPLTVVVEDASDALRAEFIGRVRNRSASVTFITQATESQPKTWINN